MKSISIVLVLLLNSCAYLISGQHQTVLFKAVDAKTQLILKDVDCVVTDGRHQKHYLATNPAEITILKGEDLVHVKCHKDKYEQLNNLMLADFDFTTVGNFVAWPAFIVDMVTYSYKKYPKYYIVHMEKVTESNIEHSEPL